MPRTEDIRNWSNQFLRYFRSFLVVGQNTEYKKKNQVILRVPVCCGDGFDLEDYFFCFFEYSRGLVDKKRPPILHGESS